MLRAPGRDGSGGFSGGGQTTLMRCAQHHELPSRSPGHSQRHAVRPLVILDGAPARRFPAALALAALFSCEMHGAHLLTQPRGGILPAITARFRSPMGSTELRLNSADCDRAATRLARFIALRAQFDCATGTLAQRLTSHGSRRCESTARVSASTDRDRPNRVRLAEHRAASAFASPHVAHCSACSRSRRCSAWPAAHLQDNVDQLDALLDSEPGAERYCRYRPRLPRRRRDAAPGASFDPDRRCRRQSSTPPCARPKPAASPAARRA